MSQVKIEIYEGAIALRQYGKVVQRFDRNQTGVVTLNPDDADDAEAPETERWDPLQRASVAGKDDLEVWMNNLYTVTVGRNEDKEVLYLSIRRNDRHWARDWRHFQRIKNEICGPEIEAVEIYPAESRLVDEANQYHLWCFPPGVTIPFGFTKPAVDYSSGLGLGHKQRGVG